MKPSALTNRDARQFPLVNYHYNAATLDGFVSCRTKSSKSLRDITRDYFDGEANRDFLSEAALFVALIAAPLVPLVSGASAVFELCRTLPLF